MAAVFVHGVPPWKRFVVEGRAVQPGRQKNAGRVEHPEEPALKDANQYVVAVCVHAHVGARNAREDAPAESDQAPDGGVGGDGDGDQHQENDGRQQDDRDPQAGTAGSTAAACARSGFQCRRRRSWESLEGLQCADSFVGGDFAGLEPVQHFRARRRRVGFNELQLAGDAVEPCLDGGVADAEGLLHLLDGAVRAEEGDDEDLVFQAEAGQFRERELAFDGDSLLRDTRRAR